ncbi:conserved hypothetical protein [Vibrio chagasii]|nr:conserved hypothetical protein [Vibrio chagasii]CAH6948999.1 conserved hypothetical protein [Vibrio chagasii]CAH7035763.1 conserved hypothetical protein [Vibrio chagasii]CAH7041893.1 conserved hypothetical protein [Vibrio chagasii]CAH7142545.1 conserved hypothetical protein [Vibrio chagasii]
MKALQSLTDVFKRHIADEKHLLVWAEDGALFCTQGEAIDGFEVEYTGIVFVQDAKLNPSTLFMHIVSWLNQHDPLRPEKGLAMPTFAVEPLDNGRFDFKLKLDLCEEYRLVADEEGDWQQMGERYRCESTFERRAEEYELGELVYFVGHLEDLPDVRDDH